MICTEFLAYVILNCFYLWIIRNVLGQLASAVPQTVTVTPEEREAIDRVSSSFDTISLTIGVLFHFSLKICSRITVLKLSWSLAFFIHALKSIVGTAPAKFE